MKIESRSESDPDAAFYCARPRRERSIARVGFTLSALPRQKPKNSIVVPGRTCMKTMLIVGIASVLTLSMNVARAQSGASSDTGNAAAPNELAEVIVTGTRRLDRTVSEYSAPIHVLTGAQLA